MGEGKECNLLLILLIAGRRSKLGSSLNHTSPHPHTAIVGNISLFRKICVSLRSYATLWGWAGNFVFIFTLHYWDYGKKDRRCVWLLWCECLIRWRCSHILFYKLADQKLTWTLQLHCKIPEWMETLSAQYYYGETVKANLWHCYSSEVHHGSRTCWILLPKELYL